MEKGRLFQEHECLIICLQLKGRGTRRLPQATSSKLTKQFGTGCLATAFRTSLGLRDSGLSDLAGDLLLILQDPTGLGEEGPRSWDQGGEGTGMGVSVTAQGKT